MTTYRVKIEKGVDTNFFNLQQLDEDMEIELVDRDEAGNEIYRVETELDINRELELMNGVLEHQIQS